MPSIVQRWLVGPVPVVATCVLLFSPSLAPADSLIVTEAMNATTVIEIFIEENAVRVELEASVPDLRPFEGIFPDDFRVRMGLESQPDEVRLKRFFSDQFVVRADGGAPRAGRLISFETRRRARRDEITGEPLTRAEDAGKKVVFVVFGYELDGRPETLTFKPPTDDDGGPSATIGFITYHQGLPVMDFGFLVGEETLDLDWGDPWFSRFRDRDLGRQDDSPLNVFLYVEPTEVRVEVIARPVDIQTWTDLGIGCLKTIPAEIQEEVKQRVGGFFAGHLDLTIDGEPVTPVLDRVNFVNRRWRTSTVITPARELDAKAATLAVVFVQPRTGTPRETAVTWELFSDRIERIFGAAIDETGPQRSSLERDDNVLRWKSSLDDPTAPSLMGVRAPPTALMRLIMWLCRIGVVAASVLLLRAGARAAGGGASRGVVAALALAVAGLAAGGWIAARSATVNPARASDVVSALLHNLYRSFDSRDEGVIRETLERSVAGDQATEACSSIRRGLELAGEGRVRARVEQVEVTDLELLGSDGGLAVRCAWVVEAAVGHWGHRHQRRDRVVADLRIEVVDGVWKITGLDLVDRKRL